MPIDWPRLTDLLAQHVQLSFAALGLALVIALPLAIWSVRNRTVAGITLGFASLVQTIPALALLALFFPLLLALSALFGDAISPLGFLPSLLALTLYALLPILRNAVTGLRSVEPAMVEAADGVGMTGLQKLWLVEAPLASTTIMAGVRTAAVWTIGAATLSTTVGQPSLGDLIFAGLQTQNWTLVLEGCLAAAGLAITVDLLLGLIESGIAHRRHARIWGAAIALALGLALALWPAPQTDRPVVTIGAKRFSEQYILARLIGRRLEAAGYAVRYREGLGSAVVYRALASDEVQVYVDYAGTIWTNEMQRQDSKPRPQMLAEIARWAQTQHGVRLIGPLGFENTYAFAVRPDDAKRLNLRSLDDVVRVAPDFVFGTDVEFLERPEWQMVQKAYPLRFKARRAFEPTFMYRALSLGEADIISAFSSDGRIAANGLVVLADPKGAVPSYDAILLASRSAAADPRLIAALEPLVGAIPVEKMREANYRVDRDADKQSPSDSAIWLDRAISAKTEDKNP
ncbi:osmoprotectant transport system permease protein [Blastomonas natatoria]|uniref:Osmoprotectant transport system permease protein n=1 Tax=Blastomonas natatoria TaxID=34015 RepID=A0A2V3VRV4_9SPHN|nr:ABC transporter permease/substrate-binding protein [Blastomonas natatoria]PXW79269.1 osmoprotectant transport system permease protein [Blastomonas natatoria]